MEERIVLRPESWLTAEMRPRIASWLTPVTLWQTSILLSVVGLLCIQNLSAGTHDFWRHVHVGQIIVTTGSLPTVDLVDFTHTGDGWGNQAWLVQVVMYLLYSVGGLSPVIFIHALAMTIGYTLVLRHVTRHHGLSIGIAATLIGVAIGAGSIVVGPQSVSFLYFGILIYLIENHRRGHTRRLWWAIPLFVLWVNSHGAFVFGIGALWVYVAGRLWAFWLDGGPADRNREIKTMLLVGLLSLYALAFNPEGPVETMRYVLGGFEPEVMHAYSTTVASSLVGDVVSTIVVSSFLLLVVAVIGVGVRLHTDQIMSVMLFALLALWSPANAAWYGFVLIPVLAATGRAWLDRRRPASTHTVQ